MDWRNKKVLVTGSGGFILKDVPKNSFFTMPDLIKKMIDQKRGLGTYLIKEDWFALEQISQIEEANRKI